MGINELRNVARDTAYSATGNARVALGALSRAAKDAEWLAERDPDHAEALRDISARLWAMTDVARDAERQLADIHAQLRATT